MRRDHDHLLPLLLLLLLLLLLPLLKFCNTIVVVVDWINLFLCD